MLLRYSWITVQHYTILRLLSFPILGSETGCETNNASKPCSDTVILSYVLWGTNNTQIHLEET